MIPRSVIGSIQANLLRIRLQLQGCTNRPVYRFVVDRSASAVNDQPYDVLGYWDPMPNAWGESVIGVDLERVKFWMGRGAMPNKSVQYLLGQAGFFPSHPIAYRRAYRRRQLLALQATTPLPLPGATGALAQQTAAPASTAATVAPVKQKAARASSSSASAAAPTATGPPAQAGEPKTSAKPPQKEQQPATGTSKSKESTGSTKPKK